MSAGLLQATADHLARLAAEHRQAEWVLFSACDLVAQRFHLDPYDVRMAAAGIGGITLAGLVDAPPRVTDPNRPPSWRAATYARLVDRDGEHCQECEAIAGLQIDHLMPRALGGTDDLANLQLLCGPCNRRKRSKHPDEWRAEVLAGKAFR